MINNISITITALSTFPDRKTFGSARAYATAVATWLNENKNLSIKLADLIPELNGMIDSINETADSISGQEETILAAKQATIDARNEAVNAVSTLPDGTVNDATISATDTWSSQQINNKLSEKVDSEEAFAMALYF